MGKLLYKISERHQYSSSGKFLAVLKLVAKFLHFPEQPKFVFGL